MPSPQAAPGLPPAQELERLKGLFLATLNHEIRTPLAGVVGMADLLLETNLDEEQRDYATTARLCAEDLLRILSAALQYAALEAGQVKLEASEFNVRELADAAIAEHASKAQVKNLRLFSTLEAGIPATLAGDGAHVKEALGYLLDNAIKFTHHGTVELAVSHADGVLRLAVRDTGIGIPADRRERIFESFRQLDEGLAREFTGVGLGLTLASKLVALMDGRLTVESEPAKGSTFTVEIPMASSGQFAGTQLERGRGAQTPRVLAVEDNPVGAAVIRHALKRHPIELHCAASGEEALQSCAGFQYDLILMDMQMPGMNGLETTAAIRKLAGYATVPILALTADISEEVRRECYRNGMQGFLTKPIHAEFLWAAIRRGLKLDR
ncbi:MAG TPA: ATP-binding protein [Bryobacteraceae bacterium]|nr:ATP-binding protein [Bryobacteraceae bacterium]